MKIMLNFLNLFINYIKYFKTFENNIKETGSDKISKEKDIIIKPCTIKEYGYEVLGDYTQTYSSGERKEIIKIIKITEMNFYGFQFSSFLKHGNEEIRINLNNISEQNNHNIKIKVDSIVFNVTAIVDDIYKFETFMYFEVNKKIRDSSWVSPYCNMTSILKSLFDTPHKVTLKMVKNIQFNSEIHDKSYPNEIYSVSYSDSNTDSWELSNLRIKKKNKECPIINLLFADPRILLAYIESRSEYTIENNICLARPFDKDYLFFECKDISESNMNIAKKVKKNTYNVGCYIPDDDLHNKFKQDVECMVEIEKYD